MSSLAELENVSLVRDKNTLLEGIDLKIDSSQQWAILGPNGSGKSMLLSILSARNHPTEGEVKLLGRHFKNTNLWTLRQEIGVVGDELQKKYQRRIRVLDVVCSGFYCSIGLYRDPTEKMKDRSIKTLQELNILHLRDRWFESLSHGEQKKTLIARALALDPTLLILDEPCSGLDIPTRERFLKSVQGLAKNGRNIIYITHHLEEVMPYVTHMLLLKQGGIYDKGLKKDLMSQKKLTGLLGFEFDLIGKNQRYYPKYF